jgi:hypothetical protein
VKHFLLVYDRKRGLLDEQVFDDANDALTQRFALEREYAGQDDVEVVVLSATSRQHIKATHGRYFRDSLV